MRAFEFVSPTTKEQAASLLASSWGETEVLAGGTDLLSLMKDEATAPKRLVNIKGIAELRGISFDAKSGLRLGALATLQDVLDDPTVRKSYPAIHTAAAGVTSPQIRAMGTVGGDLCQRPRCWYFRSGLGLFGQGPGGRPLAVEGDNRYHAILGNAGPAYHVNPSSLAPALIALGATVRAFGPRGARDIPAEKFFTTPKSASEREYDLRPNEIVTEVRVPPPSGRSATYEVREKEALDWPLAAAAVALKMNGNGIQSARVVLGHVAPVPWVSPEAAAALAGKPANEQTAKAAGEAALKNARALSGNAYKIQLARVAVKRAVLEAARGGAR
jgi:xanthine dehydrogenase YagS FAD-binding subunit